MSEDGQSQLPDDLRQRLASLTLRLTRLRQNGILPLVVQLVRDAYERRPADGFVHELNAMISRTHEEAWRNEGHKRAYIAALTEVRDLYSGVGLTLRAGLLADDDSEVQADVAQERVGFLVSPDDDELFPEAGQR